eukprot:4257992-Prymnesium_polylepis.1
MLEAQAALLPLAEVAEAARHTRCGALRGGAAGAEAARAAYEAELADQVPTHTHARAPAGCRVCPGDDKYPM